MTVRNTLGPCANLRGKCSRRPLFVGVHKVYSHQVVTGTARRESGVMCVLVVRLIFASADLQVTVSITPVSLANFDITYGEKGLRVVTEPAMSPFSTRPLGSSRFWIRRIPLSPLSACSST